MVYTGQISPDNIDIFMPMIPEILISQSLSDDSMRFYGVSVDGEASGIVAVRLMNDTADLRFMYLLPNKRNQGYMDRAVTTVLFDLYREGFARVIMNFIPSEYRAVDRICERFGFTRHKTERSFFRFNVSQVRKCKAITYVPQGTLKLRALPAPLRNDLYKKVSDKGYDISHIISNPEIARSLEEHSLVYMENGKPLGLMLVQDMRSLPDPDKTGAFGRIFPEGSSADIALIYIGSTQVKAPLYLVSALARDILTGYRDNELITGYFPEGHLTKLLEGTLGIQAMREITCEIALDTLEKYYE